MPPPAGSKPRTVRGGNQPATRSHTRGLQALSAHEPCGTVRTGLPQSATATPGGRPVPNAPTRRSLKLVFGCLRCKRRRVFAAAMTRCRNARLPGIICRRLEIMVVLYRRRAVFVRCYRAAQLHESCHVGFAQYRIQAASWQFWRQTASICGEPSKPSTSRVRLQQRMRIRPVPVAGSSIRPVTSLSWRG
jgi:hypothetical protein